MQTISFHWVAAAGEFHEVLAARAQAAVDRQTEENLCRWRNDPVAYAHEKLGVTLVPRVAEAAQAVADSPLVMVDSANSFGKSVLAAVIALWSYDTRDPSATIVTAPTSRQVEKVIFKEIRRFDRGRRPGFSPKAPNLQSHAGHMLTGYTAISENSFQGLRGPSTTIIVEEHNGLPQAIFTAIRGMMMGGGDKRCLAIGNPIDPGAPARAEAVAGGWRVFTWTAFEHPNVPAELAGLPPVVPDAVRLGDLAGDGESKGNLRKWGEFVADGDEQPGDVDLQDPATYGLEVDEEEDDGSEDVTLGRIGMSLWLRIFRGVLQRFPGRFWRATTPEGEARILARYPSQGAFAAYGEAGWDQAARGPLVYAPRRILVLGCDVARFGTDATVIHGQIGGVSVLHESYRSRDTQFVAGLLKRLAIEWAAKLGLKDATLVPLVVDDTGVGGGVTDALGGFNRHPIVAQEVARNPIDYPDKRSEMHFALALAMAEGRVSTAGLPADVRAELRRQSLAMLYEFDPHGRRRIVRSRDIKKALSRSPDDLTAMALAHYVPSPPVGAGDATEIVRPLTPMLIPHVPREPMTAARSEYTGGHGRRISRGRFEP